MLRAGSLVAALLTTATAWAQVTHYRSIGSRPPYSAGTVTVVNGDAKVIGVPSVQWRTENRGRGDRIEIASVPYTVLTVDAENELTLTAPYAGATATGVAYTISRKFGQIKDWEECISDAAVCPGVSSPSLVADGRVEVGLVYKDSVYFTNTGGENIHFSNEITDAIHKVTLTTTPENRHHGIAGTGVILDNGTSGSPTITIEIDYLTIEWLELRLGNKDHIEIKNLNTANEVTLRNLLLHDDDRSDNGLLTDEDGLHLLFYNNVIYGTSHGVHIQSLADDATGSFELYHNTFFDNVRGIHATTTTAVANDVIYLNNNLAHSNLLADFDAQNPNPSSSHNYSGDGTGPLHGPSGAGFVALPDLEFVSTAPGTEDFHIKPGSEAEDKGTTIPFIFDDWDGRARDAIPDIGADETFSSSANPVKIVTATSRDSSVRLEWQNPDFGPLDRVEIVRASFPFPTLPTDGVVACIDPSPVPGVKGACDDGLSPANDTDYYYSAFVYDTGGNFSVAESVDGEPIDPLNRPAAWSYSTKASTLAAAGVRSDAAFVVSNDSFFHAIEGGNAAPSGEWPVSGSPPWAPYRLPSPVQHRPVIVDIGGRRTGLLAAQDGRVYAVDAESGRLRWRSAVLGALNPAPAALVSAYGASVNLVFVGTANAGSNALIVLDLDTGVEVGRFDDGGNPDNIGQIAGVAVVYPDGPLFFTSDDGTGGARRNVWSVDVSTLLENWSDNPGPVDAAPTIYKGKLFVGTRASELIAYDATAGPPWQWKLGYANGAVKGPIFPVWPHDTVVFSTDDSFHSVQFAATAGCGSPPCLNCGSGFGNLVTPVLQAPGTGQVFVGDTNGELHELTLDTVVAANCPVKRTFPLSFSPLGAPAFSLSQSTLYIGDTGGKVYAIPWPIP